MIPSKLSPLKQMRVLVADDDAELLHSMERILGAYFGEVLIADTGTEALSIYRHQRPDVVFLDIVMPGETGLDTAHQIRKEDPDIPLAIITGHDGRAELLDAIPLGLVEFLVKPIDIGQLSRLLHGCVGQLSRRGRLRHRFPSDAVYLPAEGKLITASGAPLALTRNEQRFLKFMMARRSRVISTDVICRHMSDRMGEEMSPQALRNLVHRLRSKLGQEAVLCQKDIGYLIP